MSGSHLDVNFTVDNQMGSPLYFSYQVLKKNAVREDGSDCCGAARPNCCDDNCAQCQPFGGCKRPCIDDCSDCVVNCTSTSMDPSCMVGLRAIPPGPVTVEATVENWRMLHGEVTLGTSPNFREDVVYTINQGRQPHGELIRVAHGVPSIGTRVLICVLTVVIAATIGFLLMRQRVSS